MKQTFTLIATAIAVTMVSCAKYENGATDEPVTVTLQSTVATGSSVNKGSSVSFSLGTDASKTVNWSSKPETGVTISSSGNAANVMFNTSGTYTITGTLGNSSGSSTFTVKDSVVVLPSSYKDLAYAAGEELVLTAKRLGDSTANGGIQLGGYTSQKYPCGSWTKFTQAVSNNTLTVNFNGLLESLNPCSTGTAVVYVGGGGITAMAAGATYQLVINFKGQTYTGSIAKSSTGKFTITWPYTSGVKISPLSL
ncbi:MAG: hypothetical protein V4539_23870 [Bacteroidota bacterium]